MSLIRRQFEALGSDEPTQIGRFELLARLGGGGFAEVFLGRGMDGELVALKVLKPALAGRNHERERFRREALLYMHAASSFVPRLLAADPTATRPWVALEFIDGPTLGEVVGYGPYPTEAVLARSASRERGRLIAQAQVDRHPNAIEVSILHGRTH